MDNLRDVESEIFKLRRRAGACLQVGAVQEFNDIQNQIARLQAGNPGATSGKGTEADVNDNRTA